MLAANWIHVSLTEDGWSTRPKSALAQICEVGFMSDMREKLTPTTISRGKSTSTEEQVLADRSIKSILERNQSIADNIRRAARVLCENSGNVPIEDIVAGVKKAKSAIADRKIRVFLSYKAEDQSTAERIVDELRTYAGGKLDIAHMKDFKKKDIGRDWYDLICDKVRKSNWFILLLPDPSVDKDWCLFESGMFRGRLLPGDRLICLHHSSITNSELPPQLNRFQSVPADLKSIEEFLHALYLEPDAVPGMRPVNPDIKEGKLSEIAEKITTAIQPPPGEIRRHYRDQYLMLEIDNPGGLKSIEDLRPARVCETNTDSTRIFGMEQSPESFGDLLDRLSAEDDKQWLSELRAVVQHEANKESFYPINATLRGLNGRIYRPHLHAVEEHPSSPKRFHIILIEDVESSPMNSLPDDVRILALSVRYAFRFRWEVIEPFCGISLDSSQVHALNQAIHRIEADAEANGLTEPGLILNQFPDRQGRSIKRMFATWVRLRTGNHDGKLDVAIAENDVEAIARILGDLRPKCIQYLDMLTKRFAQVASGVSS